MQRKSIAILGSRGIPAAHGGFESFIQVLAPYLVTQEWDVTVYCQSPRNGNDDWNNIHRIHINPIFKGAFGTIIFDILAMKHALLNRADILFTVGYNTGFLNLFARFFKRNQVINMDGIEWKRNKWSKLSKMFFYVNYFFAGWSGNTLIADHPAIATILSKNFSKHKIKTIVYGAERIQHAGNIILDKFKLEPNGYGLSIARIEPENHILEIVKAWSKASRGRKLLVLGELNQRNEYHRKVKQTASNNVIFAGAIFDKAIVQALRFYAFVYMHGHSVGGTNPSLVEALGAGNAVIAHDNQFNRWVARDSALYFKNETELADIIGSDLPEREKMRIAAYDRHRQVFEWPLILQTYEELFSGMISQIHESPERVPE